MTIDQLSETEDQLHEEVIRLYKSEPSQIANNQLQVLFQKYRDVHLQYSLSAANDDEALKRALFLQWYSYSEPNYLTGLNDLDKTAEARVMDIVEDKLRNKSCDNELTWMFNYYASWDYIFEPYSDRPSITEFLAQRNDAQFPNSIDRIAMKKRGQMGHYWNSLTCFTEREENSP